MQSFVDNGTMHAILQGRSKQQSHNFFDTTILNLTVFPFYMLGYVIRYENLRLAL